MGAESAANRRADAAFAAATSATALPSGRTEYRRLADYEAEMKALAEAYPDMVRPITLDEPTVEGRMVHGIEITTDAADVNDGKPVFLHMGLHHAREWPAGEHTMEWAYELLQGYGSDAEITELVETTRTIIVPVVNPDGFTISREAATTDTFGTFSYDNKRKNCKISANTPASFTTGTCAANNAGRLRGTDLNRNYGGFWGGPGASTSWSSDTYRGDGPFSEPETRNIKNLVGSRSVTTLVTNHTFSNLWLRPPGVQATGEPLDEPIYKALGDAGRPRTTATPRSRRTSCTTPRAAPRTGRSGPPAASGSPPRSVTRTSTPRSSAPSSRSTSAWSPPRAPAWAATVRPTSRCSAPRPTRRTTRPSSARPPRAGPSR